MAPRSLLPAFFATLVLAGCSGLPRNPPTPVEAGATQALEEAQMWMRSSEPEARERAREALELALALEPGWVAPRRLLDDEARADLLGVEALRAHRLALIDNPKDVRALYLAGRLEGPEGARRFSRAQSIDPSFAWGHHGTAWQAGTRGSLSEAISREKAALARARDPYERSFFSSSLARFYASRGDWKRAMALLEQRLSEAEVSAADRTALQVQVCLIGLSARRGAQRKKSYTRCLDLLRESDLTDGEISRVVARMRLVGSPQDEEGLALLSALATRSSPARDRLRSELLLEKSPTPLALGLLERSLAEDGRHPPQGPLMRAARFAAGEFEGAVETWLAELPRSVLAEDGLPRDERLRRIVREQRRLAGAQNEPQARSGEWASFGEALLAAGWFRETRALAAWMASHDLERALSLEERAVAGLELLQSLRRMIYDLDLEGKGLELASQGPEAEPALEPDRSRPENQEQLEDLDDLLAAMAGLFARANDFLGGERGADALAESLLASPRMSYGPIGSLVHPGPRFSEHDQDEGLGTARASVPGLASGMDALGRFALLGEVLGGGGPDAVVMPRLVAEERQGTHLGVGWSGMIVFCEGADVLGRASRRGASISGAALHEGYWIDIEAVRAELGSWEALRRAFAGDAARLERVFASRGLSIKGGVSEHRRGRERRRIDALLGEGQRVRLAVLRDRAQAGESLGHLELDELVQVTAVHEEGHLTDRTRFLPITSNLAGILGLALDARFSPTGVLERLEYRAQLVALCSVPDPRLPLAQVLDAAGSSGNVTAHARAYRGLLVELIQEFDRRLRQDAARFAAIDPGHTLVHQLHLLEPEQVRSLATSLAKRKGMARR